MKKLFLAVAIFTASMTATKAQFYIGGGVGFWYQSVRGFYHETIFNISPDAGYSFNKHWIAGLSLGFEAYIPDKKVTHYYHEDGTFYDHVNENRYWFYAEPYARFTYFSTDRISLFVDGVVGISTWTQREKGRGVGETLIGGQVILRPGIAVNLTQHFSLVGMFGTFGYRHDYRNTRGFGFDLSGQALHFGFYYSF